MNKQFAPTEQKLRKAREDGDVARTQYLSFAFVGFCLFVFLKQEVFFLKNISNAFAHLSNPNFLLEGGVIEGVRIYFTLLIKSTLFCAGIFGIVAVLCELAQAGLIFSSKKLKFDLGKLNPCKNFFNIFWKDPEDEGLPKVVKNLSKLLILFINFLSVGGFIIIYKFGIITEEITAANNVSSLVLSVVSQMILTLSVLILLVSLVDYLSSSFSRKSRLRMSREEFRNEIKSSEGDPEIRSSRLNTHREILAYNLRQGVRKAKVVLSTKL